jgi:hypothetical protein
VNHLPLHLLTLPPCLPSLSAKPWGV